MIGAEQARKKTQKKFKAAFIKYIYKAINRIIIRNYYNVIRCYYLE